tara:strand:- start:1743 stop:1895 length:153 start_codon:yes stop_codon:yes gene_type:complete
MEESSNTSTQPKKISKDEAEKMSDFAQDLNDPITHVVDYGDLGVDKNKKK